MSGILCATLLGAIDTCAAADDNKPDLVSEDTAVLLVIGQAVERKLYPGGLECLSFVVEVASPESIEIAVRERHEAPCPGDPRTAPVVDRFLVERQTYIVRRFDPIIGNFELSAVQPCPRKKQPSS